MDRCAGAAGRGAGARDRLTSCSSRVEEGVAPERRHAAQPTLRSLTTVTARAALTDELIHALSNDDSGDPTTGPAVLLGLVYGVAWWVVGALLIMPEQLGMDVFVLNTAAWQSLMGHLLFGLVLALVYAGMARRQHH